jgi:predicted O-methyltransferase YrrM
VRPTSIAEVGCGYSTLFISKALQDIRNESLENEPFFNNEKVTENYHLFSGPGYNPHFVVVDNDPSETEKVLKDNDLLDNVEFVKTDAKKFINECPYGFDLVWLDFGPSNMEEYKYYYNRFLHKMNPGGIIIIHSTVSNYIGRLFLTELKLLLKGNSNMELMSFVEPHKKQQSSFTVIKKVIDYPIYTEHP